MSFLKDLLFPHRCLLCEQLLEERDSGPLCSKCSAKRYLITGQRCPICSAPVEREGTICKACLLHETHIKGKAVFSYDGAVREALHRFKYEGRSAYAEDFIRLGVKLAPELMPENAVLVPIPIHPKRRRERGYNQAALLAEAMERILPGNRLCVCPLLRRVKNTRVQKQLSMQMRRENMRGAFEVDRRMAEELWKLEAYRKAPLLLVDDIYTTGSTIEEAAATLGRELPGRRIGFFCLTIRCGPQKDGQHSQRSQDRR